jgi:hypothetical protein
MSDPGPPSAVEDDDIVASWQARTGFAALVVSLLAQGQLSDRRVERLTEAPGPMSELLRADLADTAARHRTLAGDDPGGPTLQAELFGIPLLGARRAVKALGDDAGAMGALAGALKTSGTVRPDAQVVIFPEALAARTVLDAMPAALHRLKRGAVAAIEDGDFQGEGGALFFKSAARLTPESETELGDADARATTHGDEITLRALVGARLHLAEQHHRDVDDLDAAYLHEHLMALRDGDSPPPLDDDSQNALANDDVDAMLERKRQARAERWQAATMALAPTIEDLLVHPPLPWRALVPGVAGLRARVELAHDRRRMMTPTASLAPEGFTLHHVSDDTGAETLVLHHGAERRGPVRIARHHLGGRRRGVLRSLAHGGTLMRTPDIDATV